MELTEVVRRVASRYQARCWWADLDDLKQEAWVAVLEAKETWDPNFGVPLHGYVWRAASRRLGNYLWEQSVPVSAWKRHGNLLRGVKRASVEVLDHVEADPPGEAERVEQWWEDLSWEVAKVVRAGHNGDVAERILLGREKPADIAEELQWPVHRLWRATHRARKRIRNDIDLRHAMAVGA